MELPPEDEEPASLIAGLMARRKKRKAARKAGAFGSEGRASGESPRERATIDVSDWPLRSKVVQDRPGDPVPGAIPPTDIVAASNPEVVSPVVRDQATRLQENLSIANLAELGHSVIGDFVRRETELREQLKRSVDLERKKVVDLVERLRSVEAEKHRLEFAMVAERKRFEAEMESYRAEEASRVGAELAGTWEKLSHYRNQVDQAFELGYQRCLKKHNIENDWSSDEDGDEGKGDAVGARDVVTVGDASGAGDPASVRGVGDEAEATEVAAPSSVVGFTFFEVSSVRASTSKVTCCHFSSDGKLLASGGHDKKAVLWYADTLKPKATLEEHSMLITDVRFSPSMLRLATSSFDKTVRVWDADNTGYSLLAFTGHSAPVMSLDFHPNKDDLICSCDGDGEIRYWSIGSCSCDRVFKGGMAKIRFQSCHGRYLAAADENVVSILDVETQTCQHSLQGHTKPIHSVCWDPSGEFLASVSEDSVRVWTLGSGNEGECIHELSCNGKKFRSCVFHPTYSLLLVIGCHKSLELWNTSENKTMTLSAHDGLIDALAVSTASGLVASASDDKIVKLWK